MKMPVCWGQAKAPAEKEGDKESITTSFTENNVLKSPLGVVDRNEREQFTDLCWKPTFISFSPLLNIDVEGVIFSRWPSVFLSTVILPVKSHLSAFRAGREGKGEPRGKTGQLLEFLLWLSVNTSPSAQALAVRISAADVPPTNFCPPAGTGGDALCITRRTTRLSQPGTFCLRAGPSWGRGNTQSPSYSPRRLSANSSCQQIGLSAIRWS